MKTVYWVWEGFGIEDVIAFVESSMYESSHLLQKLCLVMLPERQQELTEIQPFLPSSIKRV